ncbi:MAG: hypothetical protein A2Z73_01060 [Deltaproteobacteria bacterium RBG_13_60_28]|nr:MAG: hypothetical protein A2Z73_01060 [Deltaproteobacteria bacterium RBG_13_60_28]
MLMMQQLDPYLYPAAGYQFQKLYGPDLGQNLHIQKAQAESKRLQVGMPLPKELARQNLVADLKHMT